MSIIVPMLDSVANNKRIFLGSTNDVRLYRLHLPSVASCMSCELLAMLYVGDVKGRIDFSSELCGSKDPMCSVSKPFPQSSTWQSVLFLSPRKEQLLEYAIEIFGLPTDSVITISGEQDFGVSVLSAFSVIQVFLHFPTRFDL